ncbi:NACHT domain-containing protein [Amycolatopsis mediterranei]|uniref:NACHT domain-containing protein n=1 Tax=Amycolatopsis mediterranei TaxID=33910 RepID=UPI003414889D
MFDALVFGVGKQVAAHAAKIWLQDRTSKLQRDAQLTDLIATSTTDRFVRRKLVRQLEEIGDRVSERIAPLVEAEFRDITENERLAALSAVVDALMAADLNDALLLDSDLDPAKLSKTAQVAVSDTAVRTSLSEPAQKFFDLVLQESCNCLVRVVLQLPTFQPRAITELLTRLTAVSDDIARVLERLPQASLHSPLEPISDSEFSHRYLEYVSETMDELELFGVDVRRYRPHTSVTVAYLGLTASTTNYQRTQREESTEFFSADHTLANDGLRIEFALADSMRNLVRGQAGSGKTTLLQWIMVTGSRSRFSGPLKRWNGKIPFLLRLRSHAEGKLPQPHEFVALNAAPLASLEPEHWTTRHLTNGNAILLVDGVDETKLERRPTVRKWLYGILAAFPDIDVVVTSRPGAANPGWLQERGFNALFLEPMSPLDIVEFSHRWHTAIREWGSHTGGLPCSIGELDDYEASLLRELESQRHLRTLATSPLLCAMLCALNLDRHKQLPADRMRLYESALDLLIERRDAEREVPSASDLVLSMDAKVGILQHLAWWLALCSRSEATVAEAEHQVISALRRIPGAQHLAASKVLRYLLDRSGIIREPAEGRIDFLHRTFQEYLAGKFAAEEHFGDVLARNAHLDQWRETILMSIGHASVPIRAEIIGSIIDRAETEPRRARKLRLLAGAALETARTLDTSTSKRVEEILGKVIPPRRRTEARSLAALGERIIPLMPADLGGLSAPTAAACVRTVVFIGGEAALRLLAGYALDPRLEVQQEIESGWIYLPTERYATEVLSNARLWDGRIEARTPSQVQHLSGLSRLQYATVFIEDLPNNDLGFMAGAEKVTDFTANISGDVDLRPLQGLSELETLRFGGGGLLDNIAVLTSLPKLRNLFLKVSGQETLLTLATLDQIEYLSLYANPDTTLDFRPFISRSTTITIELRGHLSARRTPRLPNVVFERLP